MVARPSRWGNPYVVDDECSREDAVRQFEQALVRGDSLAFSVEDMQRELVGRDLACWCPLDESCHADVLIRLANQPPDARMDR